MNVAWFPLNFLNFNGRFLSTTDLQHLKETLMKTYSLEKSTGKKEPKIKKSYCSRLYKKKRKERTFVQRATQFFH